MVRVSHNRNRGNQDPYEAIKDDIATIRRDLTSFFAQRMGDVGDRTRDLLHDGADRARAVHHRVGEYAGENPITTIAVAALAGAVGVKILGWFLRH